MVLVLIHQLVERKRLDKGELVTAKCGFSKPKWNDMLFTAWHSRVTCPKCKWRPKGRTIYRRKKNA